MATGSSVFNSLFPFPKVYFLPVFSFNLFFFCTHGYDLLQPDLICSQLEPWLETLATHLPALPPPAAISPPDVFSHTGSASCCFFLTWQTQLLSLDLQSPRSCHHLSCIKINHAESCCGHIPCREFGTAAPNATVPTTTWHRQGQVQACCGPSPSLTSQPSVSGHLNPFSSPLPFPSSWLILGRRRKRKKGGQRRAKVRSSRSCCVYTRGAVFVHMEFILFCRPLKRFFSYSTDWQNWKDLGDQRVQPTHFTKEETEMWGKEGRKEKAPIEGLSSALDAQSQVPHQWVPSWDHTALKWEFSSHTCFCLLLTYSYHT